MAKPLLTNPTMQIQETYEMQELPSFEKWGMDQAEIDETVKAYEAMQFLRAHLQRDFICEGCEGDADDNCWSCKAIQLDKRLGEFQEQYVALYGPINAVSAEPVQLR